MTTKPGDAPAGRALRLLVRSSWDAGRWLTIAGVGSELIVALGHIGAIYGGKMLVDGALEASARRAIVGGVVIAVSMASRQVCSWADMNIDLGERTAMQLESRVIDLSARLPGIEHHERPELLDQLHLVREQRHALGGVVYAFVGYIAILTSSLASVVLLGRLHPALLLVLLAGVVSVVAATRAEAAMVVAAEATSEDHRLTMRLEELARDPRAAAELRLHGLDDLVLRRHREAGERVIAVEQQAQLRATALSLAGATIFSIGQIAAIAFAAWLGARGRLSPGDIVLAVGLVRRAASQVNGVIAGLAQLLRTLRSVRRLAWLVEEVEHAELAIRPADPAEPPDRLTRGIRFDDVTFRYPGTESPALDHVSIDIPAGSTLAIVGENGAGKSTIVKLLLRLYEPDAGRILVDDVELARIDPTEWRARASGAFQDFARFELIAREVVGVGDVDKIHDEAAIGAAIAAAGADDTVARLADGLATRLGPSFGDGVELSGGQWQLLALARGMMRARPLLLVLDEPTAALDPGREHRLFEQYAAAARIAAAETGGITLLVSHRFSTVRMADRIVVIDAGRVAETGTHDELLTAGGTYAELFRLQAAAYS
jgi:ATP-binding cassette subfamily B protein